MAINMRGLDRDTYTLRQAVDCLRDKGYTYSMQWVRNLVLGRKVSIVSATGKRYSYDIPALLTLGEHYERLDAPNSPILIHRVGMYRILCHAIELSEGVVTV